MRSRIAALAFAASLVAAAPLSAQQTHFTFVNAGTVTAFGYHVGGYNGIEGTGTGATNVVLNCVDFFHTVSAGQQWDANLTSIATGIGIGNTRANNLALYREAAYLVQQEAGKNNADIGNIQATIWNLFGTTGLTPNLTGGSQVGSYWLTNAATNYASGNYTGWYVVTDINKASTTSVQEFLIYNPNIHITATPEPASMALLGTGLVGLAGVRMRRRKNKN